MSCCASRYAQLSCDVSLVRETSCQANNDLLLPKGPVTEASPSISLADPVIVD